MLFFNTDYLVRYNIYIYMLKQVMLLGVNITIYIITLDQLTISEYYNIIADEK
jgi:hypothetical protein